VMVGDRRHDIEGAAVHGMAAIGVLWGIGDREELQQAGADALCAQPDELPSLVRCLLPVA
ncbi:MAG: family hydrolase, partial [Solirubrobacterales bacterium]|nr:family hydrolase [Solirubrobacterales bacterium]